MEIEKENGVEMEKKKRRRALEAPVMPLGMWIAMARVQSLAGHFHSVGFFFNTNHMRFDLCCCAVPLL